MAKFQILKTLNAREDVEKREVSNTVDETAKQYSHVGRQFGGFL